jgi:hypothetical protein
MKTRHILALGTCALGQAISPALRAADVFKLETDIRIFRNSDFSDMDVNAASASKSSTESGKSWSVLKPPVSIRRGEQTLLSADGASYAWNQQSGAESKFIPFSVPSVVLKSGEPARVMVSQNVQYFEKLPSGDYRLHEVPGGPDAAFSILEFKVQPSGTEPGRVSVEFESSFSVVGSREKIPGVDLDVGKPTMASFKDGVGFSAAPGEWSCILGRGPAGNDYGILILLRVNQMPAEAAQPVAAGKSPASEGTPVLTFRLDASSVLEIAPTRDDWEAAFARLSAKDQAAVKRLRVVIDLPDPSIDASIYYEFPFGRRSYRSDELNKTERLNIAAVVGGFNDAFPGVYPRKWSLVGARSYDQINELASAVFQRHWVELVWTFRNPQGKAVTLSADDFGPGVIRDGATVGSLVREMDQSFAQVFLELIAQMGDGR